MQNSLFHLSKISQNFSHGPCRTAPSFYRSLPSSAHQSARRIYFYPNLNVAADDRPDGAGSGPLRSGPRRTTDGHKSPARRPEEGRRGGVRRRYRGRRAGRIVQARRLRAIYDEHHHRQDYGRALIPLSDPGLAPGIEESPAVQTRGRPGLTADGCQEDSGSDSFRRVEGHLPPSQEHHADVNHPVRPDGPERQMPTNQEPPLLRDRRRDELLLTSLNVQSLLPKILPLRCEISDTGADIIILSETWLKPRVPNRLVAFPGYQLIRADRADGRGFGGVAILARDGFQIKALPKPEPDNSTTKLETVWARVSVGRDRGIVICAMYRPPSPAGAQLTADLEQLESEIQTVLTDNRGLLVLAGDLNCDLRVTTGNTPGGHLTRLFQKYSLSQTISDATYPGSGSVLDVIVTNCADMVVRAGVRQCDFSDHHSTHALMRIRKCRPTPVVVQTRSWKSIDMDRFRARLGGVDWSPVFVTDNVQRQSDFLIDQITAVLDELAPVRRVRIRNPHPPPVSEGTRRVMAERRAALRQGDRARYKELNRLTRSAIQRDSRDNIRQRIAETGPGSMYRCVRPIIASKRSGQTTTPDIDPDTLNRYFAEIGTKTAAAVAAGKPAAAAELPIRLPRVGSDGFAVRPVTGAELQDTVARMNSSGACGADGLSMAFFKKCCSAIWHVVLCIVNTSLATSVVPDSWKVAVVQPIYKSSGSIRDPANFRPISLVPCLAKIVERIVHKQLYAYFDTNHLFSSTQHGFRRFHSTETALINVTDRVLQGMDHGEISLLVLLDLSKCFDVVSHSKLIQKLELYGVDSSWFTSYLSDHYQHVRFCTPDGRQRSSKAVRNPIGVYQGTSLGPLLYNIFSNDLSLFIDDNVSITQYADDTQILVTGHKRDIADLIQRMESTLCTLFQWFTQNQMKVNSSKTQLIVFGTRQMLQDLPKTSISVNGVTVEEIPRVKNLGIVMDRYLSFEPHINQLAAKCTGLLIGLSHAKHCIPHDVLPTIVNGLVIALIRYGIAVYGNGTAQAVTRIQKLLNFCARVVSGRRKCDHVRDVLHELNWLPAQDLVMYRTLCLLKVIMTQGQPSDLARHFHTVQSVRQRSTRQDDLLSMPRIRTESGRRRFVYRAARAYNGLPSDTRETSVAVFRRRITEQLGLARRL